MWAFCSYNTTIMVSSNRAIGWQPVNCTVIQLRACVEGPGPFLMIQSWCWVPHCAVSAATAVRIDAGRVLCTQGRVARYGGGRGSQPLPKAFEHAWCCCWSFNGDDAMLITLLHMWCMPHACRWHRH